MADSDDSWVIEGHIIKIYIKVKENHSHFEKGNGKGIEGVQSAARPVLFMLESPSYPVWGGNQEIVKTGKGLLNGNNLYILFEPAVLAAVHQDGPGRGIVVAKGRETAAITPAEGLCPLDLDGDQAAFLPRPIGPQ